MPIRIYTTSPSRQLLEDRPFGIVAWADAGESPLGEAYLLAPCEEGGVMHLGVRFPLCAEDFETGIERQMRVHLGKLWAEMPAVAGTPFEQLNEEIPVEEFVFTQVENGAVSGALRRVCEESQSSEVAAAFADFRSGADTMDAGKN